ncbi:MAG: hypothetical protein J6A91_06975 [Bacteroidales bacterium]|nr:hypothetical protein [Bacteroidales bacterium]
MKTRVFYFALAVAAAAIASSCVKEQAEPMDPEAEITGQVFEASHEVITKSTLVDLTPTWAEGDQISVSGSDETLVCTFVKGTENKFQTEEGGAVESPFYAIYPAADVHSVNRETGVFTATVPSLQKIDVKKEQNVAQGALVSVAYSETPELQFRNAVGLVKINIARNDIMAVKIEGLGENEFVAGKFTMKLNGDEEPEIALVEGTGVTSVTLNTVENYGMFTPGEYYATVLPCNLSGIKVTFSRKTFTYGENGEVSGTGSETISVQKQSAAEIKRNAGTNLGTFFTYEISTADELLAWNKANAKWTVWDVVTLKDNIDCQGVITSENWTPNEFKGVFDGNGKTIDNLVVEKAGPAAFFSRLASATVKNLTFGAGCSFSSSAHWDGYATRIYAASLAADVTGNTTLTNVVNKGAVKTTSGATGGSTGNYVGGICAYYRATGNVSGCQNYGEVSFPATPAGHVWCGGIFGYIETGASVANCTNHGHVLFNGTNSGNKSLYLGGITAEARTSSFNTCVNLGTVEINATAAHGGHAFMGGIVGVNDEGKLGEIVGCVNGSETDSTKGAVTNNSNTSGVLRIGGFIGYIVTNASDIANTSEVSCFKNYGTITNKAEIGNWAGIGGVAGYVGALAAENTITGCENHGTVVNEKVKAKMNVGGIVGFIQDANTTVTGCKNHGEVKNTGTSPSGIGVTVAGIVGRIEARTAGTNTISLCENHGVISYAAKNESDGTYFSGAAGILGGHTGKGGTGAATVTVDQCKNFGTVTKSEDGNSNLFIGGIAGFFSGTEKSASHIANVTGCTNGDVNDVAKGVISNESSSYGGWYTYTGGVVGYHRVSGELSNCNNYGTVTNKSWSNAGNNADAGIRVGGIGGHINATMMKNCTNYAVVSDQSTSLCGYVGGIAGRTGGSGLTMTNCDNRAAVSGLFNHPTARRELAVGGLIGVNAVANTMTDCDNTGNVTQSNTTAGTIEYVGGLVAYSSPKLTVSNCSSNATVSTTRTVYTYVGALFGRIYAKDSSVSSTKVYGTFEETELNADNLALCYGVSSEFKVTDGITYGKDN